MSEWLPYQTDYLFLLVGANPLPNYVAALLLAKENGTIYLLHSVGTHGTEQIAARLKQVIKNQRSQVKVIPREIDESDSSRITAKMSEILKNINNRDSVGLHYTGGTKAMAVHVYRALERKFPSAVFSYLDTRTLSLRIDGHNGTSAKKIQVGQACKVKLTELLALHGRAVNSLEKYEILPPKYEQAIQGLLRVHTEKLEDWRGWCNKNLRRPDNKSKFKSKTDLKDVYLPDNLALIQVFEGFGNIQTLEQIPLPEKWKIDDLAEWLDGKWLEHYAMSCVEQEAKASSIHDYGMNVQEQQFEFDVAVMRGYQLFALSCTTSDERSLCKQKLFEAFIRARQMGGDEARVALVCCYRDPAALQQEIEETWFTEGRVRVFGRQDLLNLKGRLKDWFETANDLR